MKGVIKLGTRASDLAIAQARETSDCLSRTHPDLQVEIVLIHAVGDHDKVSPIARLNARGVFVSTLEDKLRSGEIDAATHSLKDMPTDVDNDFTLAAVLERLDPRDVLLSSNGTVLKDLPPGARVGTGSPRRAVQIKAARPDLQITHIRGNIDTRIRKLDNGDYDAIVLAAAGLIRMGWQRRISEYLPPETCLPAMGQGALAIETLAANTEINQLFSAIQHTPTRQAVDAERSFLRELGSGCLAPVTAYATVTGNSLNLSGLVGHPDTLEIITGSIQGSPEHAESLGIQLAEQLKAQGAAELLSGVVG